MRKKKKIEWGYLCLLPGIAFVGFFLVAAIGMMVMQSFGFLNYTGESGFSLSYWRGLLSSSFADNLLYSLKIAVFASLICIAIVYPLSLAVQKLPGKKTWLSLLKIPMFIPSLVCCLMLINVISFNGILNVALVSAGIVQEPLVLRNDSWGVGALITQVWKNIPFMLLIVYSSVESVRKDVLDAGKNLGASRIRLFFEVTLPITMPSALIAVIMTFIKIFNDYQISKIMGPVYPSTLSNLMHKQAYLLDDWHTAACVGCLMMVTSVLFVSVYTWLGNHYDKRR